MFSICFELFFNNSGQDLISTAIFAVFYCSPAICTWLRNPSGKFSFYSFYNVSFPNVLLPGFGLGFFFEYGSQNKIWGWKLEATSETGKFISTTSFVILHFVTQYDISILYKCIKCEKNLFKCLQYGVCWSSNKALLFAFLPKNPPKTVHGDKCWVSDQIHQFIHS